MSSTVLIVDDESSFRVIAEQALLREGYRVLTAESGIKGVLQWRQEHPDVVILDRNLPDADGVELLQGLVRESRELAVGTLFIVATAHADVENAVQALHHGADDYLTKPIQLTDFIIKIQKALETRRLRNRVLALTRDGRPQHEPMLTTRSPAMENILENARRVSQSPSTHVLLQGESGTGKEVLARFIHSRTPGRSDEAFVEVNCAALTEGLLESELFGHERGAFTDAKESKRGLLELASGGTLFLDEIGELSVGIQAKLLRALDTMRFRRIGGNADIAADVRIIAATNRDLLEEIAAGRFRLDLYHRLNVFSITLMPLRERREDMIALARWLLTAVARRLARTAPELSPEVEQKLLAYHFPGNVRELRNALERALIVSSGKSITAQDLMLGGERPAIEPDSRGEPFLDVRLTAGGDPPTLAQMESLYVEGVLHHTRGNRKQAARLMDVSYTTVIKKIADYHIQLPR